ncbi:hypothetical protein Tco_0971450 [Tanacetum coccineum]
MVGGNGGNQFRQYAGQNARNQIGYNAGQIVEHQNIVHNVKNQVGQNAVQNPGIQNVGNQNGLIVFPGIANPNVNPNKNGNVVAAQDEGNGNTNNGDIDDIEEVNANCILMANLQQASTSGTETNKALVYDSDGSTKVTRAYFESLYNNLVTEVEKVNAVNRKMKETNVDLTTELARYRGQEKSFEINKAKFDELETGYRKSVYQELCLTKKINALHLSSAKQITVLNEEITNLNNQLSNENSTISLRQSIQMMHMLSPKPDSFYHTKQKMALGYQNPFYLKQAQHKQQSLYNGRVLLEKHDPPVVYDYEETLQLAQESRLKMKQLNKEIKPANYAKINKLSEVFVSQKAKSREEIIKDEIAPIFNQTDARVQNFENHFVKEAAKFVREFKSLAKEADEYLDKIRVLEKENERLLRAFMQHQIEWLQAQLGDLKGKSMDTQCASKTLDPLSQKLEDENVSLEFQVLNYAKENAHLKTTYKNLFGSIKQCLITSNHDVCVLNYVNDMNSRADNQNANVLNAENKKKHKLKVKKTKNVRSKERLASPKPRKPRTCLRWSPTRRFFDLKGKLVVSSESQCQSDNSTGDNACNSDPKEPTSTRFPNSTFSLAVHPNLFMVHRLGLFQAYDQEFKASY